MLSLCFAFDQLRPDDISNCIGHECSSGHDGFLGSSSDITSTDCNDQADNRTKETSESITNDGGSRVVSPLRLPDHDTACNNRETACDEHWNACVRDDGGNVSAKRNENDTDPAHRELEQNRVQSIVAKGRNDQGSESRNCSVDRVPDKISMRNLLRHQGDSRCCHHKSDQVDLGVGDRLLHLAEFDLLASNTCLAPAKPLHGNQSLFGGEEPSRDWRVRHDTAPKTEQEGKYTGKNVNILPALQSSSGDLSKAIVECSTNDREPTNTGEPPSLSHGLLFLRVIATDNSHESGGNDALDDS